VVLITDLMDKQGYEEALKYLVAQEMDVYLIHVLSQEEIDPEIAGDLRLIDCDKMLRKLVSVNGCSIATDRLHHDQHRAIG